MKIVLPRLFTAAAATAMFVYGAGRVAAQSPGLTQCGWTSGLTANQLDFAAFVAFMSDAHRRSQLGTSGVLGQISLCASQIRQELCTAKGIMSLLNPKDSVLGGLAGGAFGAATGGTSGALLWGTIGATVTGMTSTAADLKSCVDRREALTRSADLLILSRDELGGDGRLLDYQSFVAILNRHVPRALDRESAELLARAARETATATARAAR